MTFDFYMGLAMGALFIGAVAVLIASRARPAPGEIEEWDPESYTLRREAPRDPPRVVTRLKKNDLFWEIES